MIHNKKTKIITIEEEKLLAGETYNFRQFSLRQDGLYVSISDKKTEEINTFKVCEPLYVKKTIQNLDTKDVHILLCYWFKGQFHEIEIGMEQLAPNELIKLAGKGVDITHENQKLISTFLNEQQKLALHNERYQDVGWHEVNEGNLVFRHHTILSKDSEENAVSDLEHGSFNLKPKGTLDAWKTMIAKEVTNNLMLQMLLCMGFSAAIVGYLSRLFDDVDTLIIHLAGKSTKGKTTGALLFVSIFGLPSNKKKGLQKTWNGTSNATINMMGGNYGIPVVLDELSMSHAKSLTSELYVLASGQEKSRLTDNIEQRKQKTWATTILSTGEKSIFELTNHNVGLTVRTFEFANIPWTTSAKNADAIRKVIQENYGHAGVEFIQFLFEQGLHLIDETWEKWQRICIEKLPDSPFRTRIAKKYAIILAAGDLANQSLDLSLDLDGILTFLVDDEKGKMMSRDIGAKALNFITQQFIQHQMNFRREGDFTSPINCWGKMFIHSDCIEVAFLKNVLEQQLRLGGFDDPRVVVRDWKDKGWLVTEGDRATKRTRIFEDSEQAERKQAIGVAVPKKLQDTTYNIKLPMDTLIGLINNQVHPQQVAEDSSSLLF